MPSAFLLVLTEVGLPQWARFGRIAMHDKKSLEKQFPIKTADHWHQTITNKEGGIA